MALQRAAKNPEQWFCESGDDVTALGTGYELGTRLKYVDTGERFIWFNGAWVPDKDWIYAIQEGTN